jgi:hypothetical protein
MNRCLGFLLVAITSGTLIGSGQAAEVLPDIQTSINGTATLPPAAGAGTVYTEFASSPKLTLLLREEFARRGYRLAETKAEAAVVVELAATYGFQRTKERAVRVDFGQVFEGAAKEKSLQAQAGTGELARMNLNEALVSGINAGLFSAGLINATGLGTGLLDAIGNVTGVKAGFNRLVAGDARGFCLIGCANWNKFVQTLAVGGMVSRQGATDRLVVEAKVIDERLYPDAMFDRASRELLQGLFGAGAAPKGGGSS